MPSPRVCRSPSVRPVVKIVVISASHAEPRKANGATSAPALTPVTTVNSSRLPSLAEPTRAPAPKAAPAPPLDRARTLSGPSPSADCKRRATSAEERSSNSPLALRVRTPKRAGSDLASLDAAVAGVGPREAQLASSVIEQRVAKGGDKRRETRALKPIGASASDPSLLSAISPSRSGADSRSSTGRGTDGKGQRRTASDHGSPAGNPAISGQVPRPVALRPRLAAGLPKTKRQPTSQILIHTLHSNPTRTGRNVSPQQRHACEP